MYIYFIVDGVCIKFRTQIANFDNNQRYNTVLVLVIQF